jgi:hypothetical protein
MFMAFSGRAPNLASRILLGLLNHDRGAVRFRCAAGRHSVAELDENWFAVGGCDGGGATRRVVNASPASGRGKNLRSTAGGPKLISKVSRDGRLAMGRPGSRRMTRMPPIFRKLEDASCSRFITTTGRDGSG